MSGRGSKSVPRKSSAPVVRNAGWKAWAMRVVLISAPLILLVLLELVLRLSGVGYPTRFLLSRSTPPAPTLVQNNQFGWRFFGPQMARVPAAISLGQPK